MLGVTLIGEVAHAWAPSGILARNPDPGRRKVKYSSR